MVVQNADMVDEAAQMQEQAQPNVIGNVINGNQALFDLQEEVKSPSKQRKKGRNVTPKRNYAYEPIDEKSPSVMGKGAIRTRQANAQAGRLEQLSLN